MSNVRNRLSGHKGYITVLLGKLDQELSNTTPDETVIESQIQGLETQLNKVTELYLQFIDTLEEPDQIKNTIVEQCEYELNINVQIRRAKLRISQFKSQPITSQVKGLSTTSVQLPQLKLPTFSGESDSWTVFWDQFSAIVGACTQFDDVTKLLYLRSQLEGNAKKLVKHFECIGSNYKPVVTLLKSTYSHPEREVRDKVRLLLNLKSPGHNLKDLIEFRTELESAILALDVLGKDIDNAGWLMSVHVLDRLNPKTVELVQNKTQSDYPDLNQIRDSLLKIINQLSSVTNMEKTKTEFVNKPVKSKFKSWWQGEKEAYNINSTSVKPDHVDHTMVETSTGAVSKSKSRQTESGRKNTRHCLFCDEDHHSKQCTRYATIQSRKARLDELHRCKVCCRKHSEEQKCIIEPCYYCEGKHHTFLCVKKPTIEAKSNVCSVKSGNNETVSTALAVAKVQISGRHMNTYRNTKVLLDGGSQRTFITSKAAKLLNLKPIRQEICVVEGFLGNTSQMEFDVVKFTMRVGNRYYRIQAYVKDHIPQNVFVNGLVNVSQFLRNKVRLNIPYPEEDNIRGLDLLIGADYYHQIVSGHRYQFGVNLLKTAGGLVISGNIPSRFCRKTLQQNIAMVANLGILPSESDMTKLWSLDSLGISSEEKFTPEEKQSQEFYKHNVEFKDGQYWVRMPWKSDVPKLPTNYQTALARTRSTCKQLSKRDQLGLFNDIITDYLKKGFIERVEDDIITDSHYLPSFGVAKESFTTPIRMVFDCSCKEPKSGISLNDCLLTGPSLVELLGRVLLRFRTNPYAFSADISKAFLRIGLKEQDRNYTKFLWPIDPRDPYSSMATYRFKSVLFGATSSPFLLQATLNHHLEQYDDEPFLNVIRQSLYVDNLQSSFINEKELISFYHYANQIMNEANMPLQEWYSNSPQLKEIIDQTKDQNSSTIKLLGVDWETNMDELSIHPIKRCMVNTKRQLLSACSSVFDPLGFLSPVTITGKILVQETWQRKIEWDEDLPEDILGEWENLKVDLNDIGKVKFPRMACRVDASYRLHLFADASPKAYGAVAYLVTENTVSLLTSRARVAPLKTKTLPQLELTSAYLAVKLINYISETLINIDINDIYLWSDSEIALQWITNNKSDIVYVRNRVSEMRTMSPKTHYMYVSTADNPADMLTRGISLDTLIASSLWKNGPTWLCDDSRWPVQKLKTHCAQFYTPLTPVIKEQFLEVERYSSIDQLVKIVNKIKLAIQKFSRGKIEVKDDALMILIKQIQQDVFSAEIDYLKLNCQSKMPNLVSSLNLFLDDGLLRSKGRIKQSNLNFDAKYPILLPKKSHFTNLIVRKSHILSMHGGAGETICKIRENYWIPQIRQVVKGVLSHCQLCKRLEGIRYPIPNAPPLPKERVSYCFPFHTIGIDYTGAITVYNPDIQRLEKVYVVLYTCAVTRAVHLELARNLSAETFLNTFRRFVNRRSCPKIVITDNATNFRAGSEILLDLFKESIVQQEFEQRDIIWKFIPPRSPWHGGFYERLIGIVKGCLRKILYRQKISLDDLNTLLIEVEARVNNRPLTYINNELDTLESLTPSHLICGRRINPFPLILRNEEELDPTFTLDHRQLNDRLKSLNKILLKWENVWKKDYLLSLRERDSRIKGNQNMKTAKVGDVVLIHSEGPREWWPLGRIVQVFPDEDGIVRTVRVQTKLGSCVRTTKLLYPLEEALDEAGEHLNLLESPDHNVDDVTSSPPEDRDFGGPTGERRRLRVLRKASERSRNKLLRLIGEGSL